MNNIYTSREDKELNATLKKLQNRASRLILNGYYDSITLNDIEYSILEKLTNAESHNDINPYLWNSGMIERTLDSISEKIKKAKNRA